MHLLYVTDQRIDAYLVRALREAAMWSRCTAEPADGVEMAGGGDYEAIVMDWAAPGARCAARFAGAFQRSPTGDGDRSRRRGGRARRGA